MADYSGNWQLVQLVSAGTKKHCKLLRARTVPVISRPDPSGRGFSKHVATQGHFRIKLTSNVKTIFWVEKQQHFLDYDVESSDHSQPSASRRSMAMLIGFAFIVL